MSDSSISANATAAGNLDSKNGASARGPILTVLVILTLLGIGVFLLTVVAPLVRTHSIVQECAKDRLDDVDDEKVLKKLGSLEEAADSLAAYTRLPRWMKANRHEAMLLLGRCGPHAVPALVTGLTDEDGKVRRMASVGLGTIGPQAQAAVPALSQALSDKDAGVRQAAAEALLKIGHGAEAAIPELSACLSDQDAMVRGYAALALGAIGPNAKSAVPALIGALTDTDVNVRWRAAQALGDIGPAASTAIPALKRALEDKHESVRQSARRALKIIAPS